MIIFTGATGLTVWLARTPIGKPRSLVCLNDGFVLQWPARGEGGLRNIVSALRLHSETLNGRTVSIGQLDELG